MIHGFYFRFYRMFRCEWLSVILSKLVYGLFFVRYVLERIFYRKKQIVLRKLDAIKLISEVHRDCGTYLQYKTKEEDKTIDLSIIVPVYNYVDWIEKNIISILEQKTKYKYELILIDDGSTDGAKDILHKYETYSGVKIIYQKNQGIAVARNTGIENAVGKYIMFIDCDDVIESELVETIMSKAYKDDCDIVMCAHNLVKEKNGKVYDVIPNIYPRYNLLGYSSNAEILNYAGLPWAKIYKRGLWENVRFFPGYWFEDTIIHSLIFTQCNKFSYVPEVYYQYRWYEKNFSHIQGKRENPKSIDVYWLLKSILERYDELQIPKDERYETMLLKHLSAYYYSKIQGLEKEVVDALFVLACSLYEEYGSKEECRLPYMLRVTKKALKQGDINLWKLATKYQK